MGKHAFDLSLYLVTDSTPEILGNKNICHVVEAALKGGVTIVQYRDKTSDTGELVRVGRELHKICRRFKVPLLINDRVDVALAVGCEGVHIGQDDMDYVTARKLLGPDAIIGVSAGTLEEATVACDQGADYLGIGAIYSTATKTNTKRILGPEGVGEVLRSLHGRTAHDVRAVGIGGVKLSNVGAILRGSASEIEGSKIGLDGIAIVSAIMAASDPEHAAGDFLSAIKQARVDIFRASGQLAGTYVPDEEFVGIAPEVLKAVKQAKPISHNMTNLVVQNFAANVALAVGASPIMANYGEEAADLAKLGGALVINMGTVTPEGLKNYKQALQAYNAAGRPVVLDPVGVGATSVRRAAATEILASGHVTVIKGNEGEIRAIDNLTSSSSSPSMEQQRGVDSSSTLSIQQKAALVARLAARLHTVVILTGAIDLISNGSHTIAIENGHPILGEVTGTGCVLGTTVSAVIAAFGAGEDSEEGRRKTMAAVVAGVAYFNVAAERAAEDVTVKGPGSFVPAFLDSLARVRDENARGETEWVGAVRAYRVDVSKGQ